MRMRMKIRMLVHVSLHEQILHIVMAFVWHWEKLEFKCWWHDNGFVHRHTKKKHFKIPVVQLCVAHRWQQQQRYPFITDDGNRWKWQWYSNIEKEIDTLCHGIEDRKRPSCVCMLTHKAHQIIEERCTYSKVRTITCHHQHKFKRLLNGINARAMWFFSHCFFGSLCPLLNSQHPTSHSFSRLFFFALLTCMWVSLFHTHTHTL